ncbi:MAG: GNAT family N-acetyltransferase [Rickettsiales bacterium]|jgi:GNAT superfamily N-acetyltransferase|nr:GNAT family N-acetyltransferase [Rickettsiales bacterium]
MSEYKFELLRDLSRLPEFADVAWLSMGGAAGPTEKFRNEIAGFINNANSENPRIEGRAGLAFVMLDGEKIVGTICAMEDGHLAGYAQFNYLAVLPEFRGGALGGKILSGAAAAVRAYSDFRYAIWSTVTSGPYYDKLGLKKIGRLDSPNAAHYFYGMEI